MSRYQYDLVHSSGSNLVACFEYTPRTKSELHVKVGDEVKVRELQGHWVLAEKDNRLGYLPRAYLVQPGSLEAIPWFFPELSKVEAIELLSRELPGTYLVRPSSVAKNFALSIGTGIPEAPVCHYQIHYSSAQGFFISSNLADFSLSVLLSFYQRDALNKLGLKQRLRTACPKQPPRIYQLTPRNEEIDPNEIILQEIVGQGHFAIVTLGTYRYFRIAVKSFKNESDPSLWKKEISSLKILHHPNVVTCYGFCEKPKWIIFEYVDYCLLKQLENKSYNKNQIGTIALQIARGMVYVHSMNVIHRDLAARNILITMHSQVKISDFGLSRKLSSMGAYNARSLETPFPWEALESLTKQVYKKSTDVWMFGALLYELYTNGAMPFPGLSKEELIRHLKDGRRLPFPEIMPPPIRALQEQCMLKSPGKRPKFKQILSTFNQYI